MQVDPACEDTVAAGQGGICERELVTITPTAEDCAADSMDVQGCFMCGDNGDACVPVTQPGVCFLHVDDATVCDGVGSWDEVCVCVCICVASMWVASCMYFRCTNRLMPCCVSPADYVVLRADCCEVEG